MRAVVLIGATILSSAFATSVYAEGDAAAGANFFKGRCAACHTAAKDAGNRIGPNLFGVFGRRAASVADYNYSAAMKASGIVWTTDKLKSYLANPRAVVPGTKMTFAGIRKDEDNANTVAYLATLK
jgi:cytochrome c